MDDNTTAHMNTIALPAFAAQKALVELTELNARAEKLGLPPVTYTTEEAFREEPRLPVDHPWYSAKDVVKRKYVTFTYTTDPIQIEGYTPVAVVEFKSRHSRPIINEFPGETLPVEFREVKPECDHCQKQRHRNTVIALRHEATGEITMVGSTCVKDFIGHDPNRLLQSLEVLQDVADLREDAEGSGYGRGVDHLDLHEVLFYTSAAIRQFGWASVSQARDATYPLVPTATIVYDLLKGEPKVQKQVSVEPREDLIEEANAVIAYVRDMDAPKVANKIPNIGVSSPSTYKHNLQTVARDGFCTWREVPLVASMIQFWHREVDQQSIQQKNGNTPSEWIGEVGDKIEMPVTLAHLSYFSGAFGTTTLCKFETDTGNLLTWFASNSPAVTKGGSYVLRGRIKAHDMYKGVKQTIVTRCKVKEAT